MSYILDALRRADSERERASVPSIHAQPVPQTSSGARGLAAPRPWAWAVAGVLAVLLGQWLWQWLRDPATDGRHPEATAGPPADIAPAPTPAPPAADATVAGPQTSPPPEPVPAPTPTATAEAARGVEPPVVVLQSPSQDRPAPSSRPANAAPPHGAAGLAAAAPPATATRKAPRQTPQEAPAARPPAVPAAEQAAAPQAPVYALAELPPNVRQALPPLQVGGSVYSEDPGSRFVILNGLIFHENDKPAADVLLERIELKSAVLSFRGYRFRISF